MQKYLENRGKKVIKPIPDHAQYFDWLPIMTSYCIYFVPTEHRKISYEYLLLQRRALLSFLLTSLSLQLFSLSSLPPIWVSPLPDSLSLSRSPPPDSHQSQPKANPEVGKFVLPHNVFPFMHHFCPQLTTAGYPRILNIFLCLGFPICTKKRLVLSICKLKIIMPPSRVLSQGL